MESLKLTVSQKIKNGVRLLDSLKPGWREKISLSILDMRDMEFCVLGQVFMKNDSSIPGYQLAQDHEPLQFLCQRVNMGFTLDSRNEDTPEAWRMLAAAWKKELQ